MSDSTKSLLETLPDELFLETFHYMAPEDLCSFNGLNQRIDSIMGDIQLRLNLQNEQRTGELLSIFSSSQVIRFQTFFCRLELVQKMRNLHSLTLSCLPPFDFQWHEARRRMRLQSTYKRLSTFR